MTLIERLDVLRGHGGKTRTRGLPDDAILKFAELD